MEKQHQILLNGITIEDLETRVANKVIAAINPTVPTNTETEDFITVKQAAKLLGVSTVTIHKWKADETLRFYRFGTRIRFKKSEIIGHEKYGKGKK